MADPKVFITRDGSMLHVGRGGVIELNESVKVMRAGVVPPAIADVDALTGGEAPTEGEFNALAERFNSLLAVLRNLGVLSG